MRLKYLLVTALALGLVVCLEQVAFGQCAMCRAALVGSNDARFIRNFNLGVLILLVPPVSIFCSIFVVLRKHRGAADDAESDDPRA